MWHLLLLLLLLLRALEVLLLLLQQLLCRWLAVCVPLPLCCQHGLLLLV
jgi:hypothetical protein